MDHGELKKRAFDLRLSGLTYPEINAQLGQKLPKSTLSFWFKDIHLTQEQIDRIKDINKEKLARARLISVDIRKQRQEDIFTQLLQKHSRLSKFFNDDDIAKISLALLYLAEGSKNTKNRLVFGNSDPGIIKLFMKLLRQTFTIDEVKFRCTVQCRADQDVAALESFWSEVTNIPLTKFYKARIDPRSIGRITLKRDYKGVCRIDYFSTNTYNELRAINVILTTNN